MKFPRNAKVFRGQLDVAPFASVFFLLAIFMVFSSLLVPSWGVKINLPSLPEGRMSRATLPKLDVAVDAEGRIHFESQIVTRSEFRDRLEGAVSRFAAKSPTLVVQADQDADLETLLQICQIAVDVGVDEALLAGRPRAFEPAPAEEPASP